MATTLEAAAGVALFLAAAGAGEDAEELEMAEDAVAVDLVGDMPADRLESAKERLALHRTVVSDWWQQKYDREADRMWDRFYKRNKTNFFKDRHYLHIDYPDLAPTGEARKLMAVGCGVGNAIFPLMREDPLLSVYAMDFSATAVRLVTENELFDAARCNAFVHDITNPLPARVVADGAHLALMIFVLSAIHPDRMQDSLRHVWQGLRPGGILILRDYGAYDEAELRFGDGHKLSEHFYVRGDGTRAYYFSLEVMAQLAESAGFEVLSNSFIRRLIRNRAQKKTMHRVWIQCRLQKPWDAPDEAEKEEAEEEKVEEVKEERHKDVHVVGDEVHEEEVE